MAPGNIRKAAHECNQTATNALPETVHNVGMTLDCPTRDIELEDRVQARIWIHTNQLSIRNITDACKIELVLQNKDELAAIGKEKQKQTLKQYQDTVLSLNGKTDKPPEPTHNTRETIAGTLKMSTGKVAQTEFVIIIISICP